MQKGSWASSWSFDANSSSRRHFIVVACCLSLLINLAVITKYLLSPDTNESRPIAIGHDYIYSTSHENSAASFAKPPDFRIVGLIFAGRKDRLSILNCYLQRNLASNGGFLDEVIFVQRTNIKEDISYIRKLTSHTPEYTLVDDHSPRWGNWAKSWSLCEAGTMYIKIDDDVVFIEDTTIASVVRTKLENPNSLMVSANTFNQAGLAWVHHHLGTVLPYLPELNPIPSPRPKPKHDWRASLLPHWQGPPDFSVDLSTFEPPFPHHRWLPARHLNNTDFTPIASTEYQPGTSGVKSWAVAAQQHYSFLEHLENDELWRYRFHLWDYMYMRLSINFVAIWGDDVVPHLDALEKAEDDELFLSVVLSKALGRHVLVDGTGVAVHFSFKTQTDLDSTDLLQRYKAYADENVCRK